MKKVNFGEIYLQTAESLSQLHKVPLLEAKSWVKGHHETYCVFHDWAQEVGRLAEVRGWAATDSLGRKRYVQEGNSKGQGESAIRNAVNMKIQSFCADTMKLCLIAIASKFDKINIIATIHDR